MHPTTPHGQRRQAFAPVRFRLFPFRSPLLGESRLISFPPPTEMFHFGGYRLLRVSSEDTRGFPRVGFPIRASRDHRLLAPPPGLSQLATPFIAFGRRGIHPEPLSNMKTSISQISKFLPVRKEVVETTGFEPVPSRVQTGRSPAELRPRKSWWAHPDSNRRPYPYQGYALAD